MFKWTSKALFLSSALTLILSASSSASALSRPSIAAMAPAEVMADQLSQAAELACSQVGNLACGLLTVQRRQLTVGVAHYSMLVQVGAGSHDVIGVHRVVKETVEWTPVTTEDALFMVHGDAWGFEAAFLASTLSNAVPVDQSIAVFMAERDVDVWGIDLRWVQVSDLETDLSFMKDWNTGLHVSDMRVGLKLARNARDTGEGSAKLLLAGWSRGAQLVYTLAGEESQVDEAERDVRGIVPVDYAFRLSPSDQKVRATACRWYEDYQRQIDQGVYATAQGVLVRTIGTQATEAPDEDSTLAPTLGVEGYTNLQTALFFGAQTYLLYPATPFYHYVAGVFDETGVPVDLEHTRVDYFLDFLEAASSFQSLGELRDGAAIQCGIDVLSDGTKVTYDDHLEDIQVPVLYVEARGGFGSYGEYTPTLLGSEAVEMLVLGSNGTDPLVDFGHMEPFLADAAAELVWQPIYDWIRRH